ncbi:MAG: NAD-binding protein [Polyangiaceae bacterium]
MASDGRGHIVVCGFGHLGQSVVQLLRGLDEEVVVITEEVRRSSLVAVDDDHVRILRGDARDPELLSHADLAHARAVIAATDHDLTNVEIALDVRALAPKTPVVVRLFDQNLARMLEQSFDVRRALAMSALAAPVFAAAALDDPLLARLELDEGAFVIGEPRSLSPRAPATARVALPVSGHGTGIALAPEAGWRELVGVTSTDGEPITTVSGVAAALRWPATMWTHSPLSMRITFALLVALTLVSVLVFSVGLKLQLLDAFYFMVTTITTTGYGDITPKDAGTAVKLYTCFVMLLGSATTALFYSFFTDFIVAERFRRITQNPEITVRDHVIVVGLGNVGYRIIESLRRFGVPLVGIDVDGSAPFASEVRSHSPVLTGDGRLAGTLRKAGIARARSIVAATGDDAINLEISLAVKREASHVRVVSRLFDPAFAMKVQGVLPIERALSASRVAAPAFVASALWPNVVAAFVRDGHFVVVTSEAAPDSWDRRTVAEIRAGEQAVIAYPDPGAGKVPLADEHVVTAGDRYVVVRERPVALPHGRVRS